VDVSTAEGEQKLDVAAPIRIAKQWNRVSAIYHEFTTSSIKSVERKDEKGAGRSCTWVH
jgi:hypothetical protein